MEKLQELGVPLKIEQIVIQGKQAQSEFNKLISKEDLEILLKSGTTRKELWQMYKNDINSRKSMKNQKVIEQGIVEIMKMVLKQIDPISYRPANKIMIGPKFALENLPRRIMDPFIALGLSILTTKIYEKSRYYLASHTHVDLSWYNLITEPVIQTIALGNAKFTSVQEDLKKYIIEYDEYGIYQKTHNLLHILTGHNARCTYSFGKMPYEKLRLLDYTEIKKLTSDKAVDIYCSGIMEGQDLLHFDQKQIDELHKLVLQEREGQLDKNPEISNLKFFIGINKILLEAIQETEIDKEVWIEMLERIVKGNSNVSSGIHNATSQLIEATSNYYEIRNNSSSRQKYSIQIEIQQNLKTAYTNLNQKILNLCPNKQTAKNLKQIHIFALPYKGKCI